MKSINNLIFSLLFVLILVSCAQENDTIVTTQVNTAQQISSEPIDLEVLQKDDSVLIYNAEKIQGNFPESTAVISFDTEDQIQAFLDTGFQLFYRNTTAVVLDQETSGVYIQLLDMNGSPADFYFKAPLSVTSEDYIEQDSEVDTQEKSFIKAKTTLEDYESIHVAFEKDAILSGSFQIRVAIFNGQEVSQSKVIPVRVNSWAGAINLASTWTLSQINYEKDGQLYINADGLEGTEQITCAVEQSDSENQQENQDAEQEVEKEITASSIKIDFEQTLDLKSTGVATLSSKIVEGMLNEQLSSQNCTALYDMDNQDQFFSYDRVQLDNAYWSYDSDKGYLTLIVADIKELSLSKNDATITTVSQADEQQLDIDSYPYGSFYTKYEVKIQTSQEGDTYLYLRDIQSRQDGITVTYVYTYSN